MARVDELSYLINYHDMQINDITSRISGVNSIINQIINHADYVAETSVGEKQILADNQAQLATNSTLLTIIL